MRMTRAARKAQSGAEDEVDHETVKQGIIHIHQDSESVDDIAEIDLSGRSVLRDITEENYPSDPFVDQAETTKKSRKGRTKKTNTKVIEEVDRQDSAEIVAEEERVIGEQAETEVPQIETEKQQIETTETVVEEESQPEVISEEVASNTTKIEPEVQISLEEAVTKEDLFVDAIRSRSPAKLTESQPDELTRVVSFTDSLKAESHVKSRTSSNFEQSFEAMDSLEDSIEQITAGLTEIPAEEIPESPMKPRHTTPKSATPNVSATRTPRSIKSTSKLQNSLSWNKENAPPAIEPKTPMTTHKTPLTSRTSVVRRQSPLKSKTPTASVRKPVSTRTSARTVRSPVKTSATPMVATDRQTTTTFPRKSVIKRPVLAQTTNIRSTPLHKKADHSRAKSHGVSILQSPAKTSLQIHKRRVTSAVLSTAKPGFIPSKSSKAPTTSTFILPSEAIAEKLRAQKEAREERMKTQAPKMTPAEEKAARLKADREAREQRVRQNQARETREISGSFALSSDAVAEKLRAQKEAREERMKHQAPKMTVAEEKAARLKAEREAREERVRQNQARETNEPSTSTFTLSSEAVAEKLRIQKEAREERMKTQDGKAVMAAEKAAKLKAEREAREERVKLNQKRAEEQLAKARDGKQELNVNKVRLDISAARAEAAERGRQASREWAAKKKVNAGVTA